MFPNAKHARFLWGAVARNQLVTAVWVVWIMTGYRFVFRVRSLGSRRDHTDHHA